MRKLLLFGMLGGLLNWLPARAQVQDGTKYWGGTVNIEGNSENQNGTNRASSRTTGKHTISPELQWGKFINPATMLGIGMRYSFNRSNNVQEVPGTPSVNRDEVIFNQRIALLPFIRRYKSLNEHWAIFIHGEIGSTYYWDKFKNTGATQPENKSHSWQYELSVKPGLVYFFPKKKLAIEGYANVLSFAAQYNPINDNTGRIIHLSTGLSTRFPGYFTIRIAKYISAKDQSAQP